MSHVSGKNVTAGAAFLAVGLGSVHAFSVFLVPLEAQFEASRGAVSLTYSLALVCLTVAVLIGHRIYGRASAAKIVWAVSGFAALGALTAGWAGALPMVWLGYSLLFGTANGVGYGFGLQIAAQANPGREGLAMGAVTAAYALGAVGAPPLFSLAVDQGGFFAAMQVLAVILLGLGAVAAHMMRDVRYQMTAGPGGARAVRGLPLMWLGYFGGVMAGLMVIGHAAGLAASVDPSLAIWLAPIVIALSNLVGSLLGGTAADALSSRLVLVGLPLLSCVALLALAGAESAFLIGALAVLGFAYGGMIAAYPPIIAKRVGQDESARIYGRVFTAWGAAGLAGPWLAGALYDASGRYALALMVAAGMAIVSACVAWFVFREV